MVGISRRQTILGCGCALTAVLNSRNADAQLGCSTLPVAACSLQSSQRDSLTGLIAFDAEDNVYTVPGTIDASNIEGFDQAYGQVLTRLARIFDCRPKFAYWQEPDGVKNAYAVAHSNSNDQRGEVLFGLNLLRSYLDLEDNGDMIILSVSAHEFAHIKQYEQRQRIQELLSDNPCHHLELHADYVSGFALQRYYREFLSSSSGLQEIGIAWEQLGSSEYNNPGSHGTSAERVAAIQAGYAYARAKDNEDANIWHAMSAGVRYLRG